MKKSVLVGILLSVPLLAVIVLGFVRLFGAVTDPHGLKPFTLVMIVGAMVAIFLLWIGVALVNRNEKPADGKMSFDVTAAIAIAEAQKKGPAAKCSSCGRPRLSESAKRCLYCGTTFPGPPPAANAPTSEAGGGGQN